MHARTIHNVLAQCRTLPTPGKSHPGVNTPKRNSYPIVYELTQSSPLAISPQLLHSKLVSILFWISASCE